MEDTRRLLIQMSGAPGSDPETDIRSSPAFAEKVLGMLARAWGSLGANQQTAISLELAAVSCIPTKAGFRKPNEAYFEKNELFDDIAGDSRCAAHLPPSFSWR